ncbi:sensor histidine kinase [Butyricicoccus sp. OF13-6]|nr:sensor histidine kinase [Butyricicoccus sp. OF13-6]
MPSCVFLCTPPVRRFFTFSAQKRFTLLINWLMIKSDKGGGPVHGVRQWWVRLSIVNKAIVLSCAFVIPILLVVGLLMNDFYDYREKSNDILSEYARCTDYMNAMEQENALLSELTLAAPGSDTIDKYADAVQDTACAWERLRSAETDGNTQSEVLKQVIDRTMKSYRVRQETFIAQLHGGTFDAVNYEALRTQGSYLTQYTDQLTEAFLMEGREGYLVLGQRGTAQNMVFTIVAAIGSVLFAGAMLYYARSLLLPVQQMSRGARRVADGEYDIEDFNFARSDEIGMLADSFNHLKHQIARTIHALESEAQLEKSLRQQESEAARLRQLIEQSRFAQLQSQINPHFLFNTLQSVANMAGIEQATVTGDMVVRLANFFRYTLDHDDSVVTLDRELALLRDYISLQELRFGERISFEMDCDSRCAACELPKFTLQPIVENSIVHGMRSRSAGGRIRIVTQLAPEGCRIQITDNGGGFSRSKMKQNTAEGHRSIGLQNIAGRIALSGGSFRIVSCPGLGTTARIILPMKGEEHIC